ncbi:3-hydroxyacyl-CoA dehydrogenase NAD-binding domain-containing protein [Rudaeicoccus suwonensis]|uniref:Short chain enoyl-CoA hydratase /3-hydroxyacyl-CoA dehydrogenase n=1 Tax=Rudaeicoccus suwonensis TaxID=657409 RepID=A0A561E7R9_9MICO|nr:3-hydroxyacyl-CoA dehydrogenase NAD-binding domain-containing protein [Rudaeicoccus suwonensis]TWE11665.1 short chain enoyl-CoA hydratase /3-hydroxyacyl-CoA dehydrogenase [Rudaeicoccus suwonensis]
MSDTLQTTTISGRRDDAGIVTVVIDDPAGSANVMNDAFRQSLHGCVDWLEKTRDDVTGVVLTSAKKTFFAGGDLTRLREVTPDTAEEFFTGAEAMKADLRRLETFGFPVVAVLSGSALGGGLEIALACHHRIAVDNRSSFGFPEVTLGLLPGGGGVTRTVRMLGLADALTKVLGQGAKFRPAQAVELGLVDALAPDEQAAVTAAHEWIAQHPEVHKPWDVKGFKIPGGTPAGGPIKEFIPAFTASLTKQLKGAPYPAPYAILAAAVEGSQVDFDTASRIESRYLTELAAGQISKNMIQAFFFDLQGIKKGASRPGGIEPRKAHRVGVLGAGMMGAGIAYSLAKVGIDVVLKDVDEAAAQKGKGYSIGLCDKAVGRGRMTQAAADALLAHITPTSDPEALAGCDTVIEAVFEDPQLKSRVFAEVVGHVAPDALLCSNTSTLPITGLAKDIERPADFIGLHFFSPVDKMQLVEIIVGAKTSTESVAHAYDLVLQLGKTPIVVQDSRGFFTSRVIGTFTGEGLAMLAEGVNPVSLERAATQAGYPVGTLQISDELNLELMQKIQRATAAAAEAEGATPPQHPSYAVVDEMIRQGRPNRKSGKGFYDYDESGRRGSLWPGLATLFPVAAEQPPMQDIKDRFLFVEALESVRCVQEGVITAAADANIGSILGIGYPAWTGGVLQFINGYAGGLTGFIARAQELEAAYGPRFAVPELLQEKATRGERFE